MALVAGTRPEKGLVEGYDNEAAVGDSPPDRSGEQAEAERVEGGAGQMSGLVMPHRFGWAVMYKEMRTIPARNGRPEYTKEVNDSCFFKTKAEAEAKAEELKAKGATIRGITECIY